MTIATRFWTILKDLIYQHRQFFIVFHALFCLGCIVALAIDSSRIVLAVNGHHHIVLDYFFKSITRLGDWQFFLCLVILVCIINKQRGFQGLFIFLTIVVVSQLCKDVLFKNAMRPIMVIDNQLLHFVHGVFIKSTSSFPSGHAVIIWGMVLWVLVAFDKKPLFWVGIFAALCVCYSRLYLAQHFFVDVLFGAFIGVDMGLIGVVLYRTLKALKA